jgi:hypothetical protein
MRNERIRYDIIVRISSHGVVKQDFTFNRDPARPRSVNDVIDEAVKAQYEHLGFGVRMNGLTKYPVHGIRWHGIGVDDTDVIGMWCPTTGACVVIGVRRI